MIIVEIIGQAAGLEPVAPDSPAVSIISDVAFDLAFVAAALYFAATHGRPRAADFGFRRIRFRLGLAAFVLAGAGYYVVTAVYASLFKLHGTDKLPSELGVSKSTAALVAAAVFVCVIAPIAEEFFFRGFLFGVLRRWRIMVAGPRTSGPWVAAVITGILFGLAHTGSASSQYLIPLGFLGFVLCLVRLADRLAVSVHGAALDQQLARPGGQLSCTGRPGRSLALIVGSLVVIAALTGPLSARSATAATDRGARLIYFPLHVTNDPGRCSHSSPRCCWCRRRGGQRTPAPPRRHHADHDRHDADAHDAASPTRRRAASGSLTLFLPDAFVARPCAGHRARAQAPRRRRRAPYVAGQWVTLRAYLGRRRDQDRPACGSGRRTAASTAASPTSSPARASGTVTVDRDPRRAPPRRAVQRRRAATPRSPSTSASARAAGSCS